MRSSLSAVAVLALLIPATVAVAQQATPADTSTPPAAATPAETTTPAAPAAPAEATAPAAATTPAETPAATVATPAAPVVTPAAPTAPAMTASPKMTTPATSEAAAAVFYAPTTDEWLASTYVGHEVYGPNNERLGKITDIVMNSSGQAEAAILGVGGFLGIGRKDVAVNFKSIKSQMKNNSRYLTLAVTKPDLKGAPAYTKTTAKQM